SMNERPAGWVPRRQSSNHARLVAYDALRAVHTEDAYANLILPGMVSRARLNRSDAAFATNLAYGTLRLQGRWDAMIARCSQGRTLAEIDPGALDLLRLGCYQLIELKTPPHAAINETVALARNELGQGIAGFVNAVLRRVSERRDAWRGIIENSTASREEFLAVWHSHPRWIVRQLEASLAAAGRSTEVEAVLEANNTPAKVALACRNISPEHLKARIERAKMTWEDPYLVPSAVLLASGDPHRLWPVRDGVAGVQDEGSQLISVVVTESSISGKDESWLDMCAGPGGKTATIAATAARRGARVFANEPQAHRLDLVEENVAPWADTVALREGDGREIGAQEPDSYDRILVDAPCSGLGALRRRPEARWRKKESDLAALTQLQGELLDSAYRALRPGGLLLYTTCSPVLAETRDVISAFLDRTEGAELGDVTVTANRRALRPVASRGMTVQLWPDIHHTDAMYMARILKPATAPAPAERRS
ncbi:transcription antitermination factor NusB, partial [Actinotignum timonense]|nr:transcription antitermination factor NusB [Actinotignum timonense]